MIHLDRDIFDLTAPAYDLTAPARQTSLRLCLVHREVARRDRAARPGVLRRILRWGLDRPRPRA